MTPTRGASYQRTQRERLTAAAQKAGFSTIYQLAKAINSGEIALYYRQDGTLYPLSGSEQANVLVREDGER